MSCCTQQISKLDEAVAVMMNNMNKGNNMQNDPNFKSPKLLKSPKPIKLEYTENIRPSQGQNKRMQERAYRKTSGRVCDSCSQMSVAQAPKQSCAFVCLYSCVHCFLIKLCGSTKVLFLTTYSVHCLTQYYMPL